MMLDVKLGKNVIIPHPELVNVYGCEIGDNCMIGPFVEIQNDVVIGKNTRIQSHSFICSKTRIGKNVFIGHGAIFINDRYPPRRNPADWEPIIIGDGAVIGSNATVLPCRIGKGATIGAGAVVTKDVPAHAVVTGNPAQAVKKGRKG